MVQEQLKILKNISEAQAFNNCVKILDSSELNKKQFAFTENYIKWLLNKFDMPFVFLQPLEKVPEDERPENSAAFAQTQHCLISVPINDLELTNLYKYLGYTAHELKHVADSDFYMERLLLGKDRNYYAEDFTDHRWEMANVSKIMKGSNSDDIGLLQSVSYYLNAHEIGARENEYFYANLFLRLATKHSNNKFIKIALKEQLEKCIHKAKQMDEYTLLLTDYTSFSYYKKFLLKVYKEMKNLSKQLSSIKNGNIDKYTKVKNKLVALSSLYPNEKITKKIAKTFNKKPNGPFSPVIQTDCLEMLSKLPYDCVSERDINRFLLKRDAITDNIIRSIEPITLAERFLLLNGSSSLIINASNFTFGSIIKQNIQKIHSVDKKFENYNIIGIKNMPESKAKKYALNKFLNTSNFKLTPEVLEEYNQIFDGKLYAKLEIEGNDFVKE